MSLSMDEMQKLLKGKEKKEPQTEAQKKAEAWLNEDELKNVAKAYTNGHALVSIRGKTFTLTYDKKWDEVVIGPVEGYCPFARVERERLEKL